MTDPIDPLDLIPGMQDLASAIAARVHRGQLDKAGLPYVLSHVLDVVRRLDDHDQVGQTVAWLHDTLEDVRGGAAGRVELLTELEERFPADVVDAVLAISYNPDEETRDEYYARVKANPLARRVKFADIASNLDPLRLAMLDEPTRLRLINKYAHALVVLRE